MHTHGSVHRGTCTDMQGGILLTAFSTVFTVCCSVILPRHNVTFCKTLLEEDKLIWIFFPLSLFIFFGMSDDCEQVGNVSFLGHS